MLLGEGKPGRHVTSAGMRHSNISGKSILCAQGEGVGCSPMGGGLVHGGKGLHLPVVRQWSLYGTSRGKVRRHVTQARKKLTGSGMGCAGGLLEISRVSHQSLSKA